MGRKKGEGLKMPRDTFLHEMTSIGEKWPIVCEPFKIQNQDSQKYIHKI